MFFFFQAEDGIRDVAVTGVQTCALPIYAPVSLFLCAVILSAWFGGIRPGLLATALSAPAFYYYFLPPIYSLGAKPGEMPRLIILDRKSTRLNSSHGYISYAVFCLKKKTTHRL